MYVSRCYEKTQVDPPYLGARIGSRKKNTGYATSESSSLAGVTKAAQRRDTRNRHLLLTEASLNIGQQEGDRQILRHGGNFESLTEILIR